VEQFLKSTDMTEFAWQGFNQIEGGKPTNNSLFHSTSLIHPQTSSLLCSGVGRCPVGKKTITACNGFVKNHT